MNMPSWSEQMIGEKPLRNTDEIIFRPLLSADVEAAMRLKERAGWNQTKSDWERLLALEPAGCFAAVADEKLIGTATVTIYGRELAWIGMVLVDGAYRRRGIATRLMKRALDYLESRKVKTVKLDATGEGAFVYENLGFQSESTIERWSLAAEKRSDRQTVSTDAGEREIYRFDRLHFGADRSELLGKLIEDACAAPVTVKSKKGNLAGYALARSGAHATYLGPLVAENRETAASLLDAALARSAGDAIFLDVNTKFEAFEQILSARGFSKQRELIRMRRGDDAKAASGDAIFAVAGLEVG